MSGGTSQSTIASRREAAVLDSTTSLQQPTSAPRSTDKPGRPGDVYRQASQYCLVQWERVLGPAPWQYRTDEEIARMTRFHPARLYRRQSATLALAISSRNDSATLPDTRIAARIRASLVEWQLSLRLDGSPVIKRRGNPAWAAATTSLVTSCIKNGPNLAGDCLLDDLRRHIQWLLVVRPQRPWIEACIASALVDSAVILEDTELLVAARTRLSRLLKRQDAEGFFPECDHIDLGRHSLTIDVLARLWSRHQWAELQEPITSALRFLRLLAPPCGELAALGGTSSWCFLSPYGLELLAPEFNDAAYLANICRNRYAGFAQHLMPAWNVRLCAVLGPSLSQAADVATTLPANSIAPDQPELVRTDLVRAGLIIMQDAVYHTVICQNGGGALHITWHQQGTLEEDDTLVALRWSRLFTCRDSRALSRGSDPNVLQWFGKLEPHGLPQTHRDGHSTPQTFRAHTVDGLRRFGGAIVRFVRRRRLGWVRRTVSFSPNQITIRERVRTRDPEAAVMSPPGRRPTKRLADRSIRQTTCHAPNWLQVGKGLILTRTFRDGRLLDVKVAYRMEDLNTPNSDR